MNRSPNQPNRQQRSALTPQQEAQRAEWHRYAAEEQAKRQAAAAARRQAEEARRRREEAERAAHRAEARRLFGIRFVLYLIMVVLMLAVLGISFFVSLHKTDSVSTPKQVVYTVGHVSEEASELAYAYSDAVKDGEVYFPMSALTDLLSLTVTGTPDAQRYTTASGEYILLTVGSMTAEVNGDLLSLDGAVGLLVSDGDESLWVPLSFVSAWVQGVEVNLDAGEGKVSVLYDPTVEAAFLMKGGASAAAIDEKAEFGNTPPISFTADLSAYEEYMNPTDRDAYLTLINVESRLASDYIPSDLTAVVDTRKDGRNTQQMRLYAAKALEAFFIEMRACGITDVSVTSAYRSYSYQKQLFEDRVAMYPTLSREEAEAKAATINAIPGTSEHQSGLCVDMHNLPAADEAFANKAAFKWMSENAHKFGFILRYPEDKTAITGIIYEPWHYRYVGRYHATKIYESGLCLEEYIAAYTK